MELVRSAELGYGCPYRVGCHESKQCEESSNVRKVVEKLESMTTIQREGKLF